GRHVRAAQLSQGDVMSEQAAVGFLNVMPPEQLRALVKMGDKQALEEATAYGTVERRRSLVANLPEWSVKLWRIVDHINGQFFGFALEGIETPQFVVYREGDHFDWHMDKGPETPRRRKLSLTLQLSASEDYEGGDLEVYSGDGTITAKREPGAVLAFPSWILHRVTPVTRGERKSLVVWAFGPTFQ